VAAWAGAGLSVTLLPAIETANWKATWAPVLLAPRGEAGDPVSMTESPGGPITLRAPTSPGTWSLRVDIAFDRLRSGTWYWRINVVP
jgi:hypothetical protein